MRFRNLIILGVVVCLCNACTFSVANDTSQNPNVETLSEIQDEHHETDLLEMATPAASSPAAGICADFDGTWVTITIYPDIPDPRCAVILPGQMLEVVNMREETLTVTIFNLEADISPGENFKFEVPFEDYLLPGVHHLSVQPCCGAELVLGK